MVHDPLQPDDRTAASTRRRFLQLLCVGAASLVAPLPGRVAGAAWMPLIGPTHPDPRPGIDASRVLTAEQLGAPDLAGLFDAVREIPHIADGIFCYCGCARVTGYRSLLSCYEKPGMAQYCEICQGEARLAHARWKEGQSLAQIRRAIDARYGHGAGEPPSPAGDLQDHCHG